MPTFDTDPYVEEHREYDHAEYGRVMTVRVDDEQVLFDPDSEDAPQASEPIDEFVDNAEIAESPIPGRQEVVCTYCDAVLGELKTTAPGDELSCEACDITFDVVAAREEVEATYVVCPDCQAKNDPSPRATTIPCGSCGEDIDVATAPRTVETVYRDLGFLRMLPQDDVLRPEVPE